MSFQKQCPDYAVLTDKSFSLELFSNEEIVCENLFFIVSMNQLFTGC